jgi:hypothetical protein
MSTQPQPLSASAACAGGRIFSLAATLVLCGCEFFIVSPEPPPDPATDGILACGEVMSVDGLPPGATIPLDVPIRTSVQVFLELQGAGSGGRLLIESDTSLERVLPVWDPVLGQAVLPAYRDTDEDLQLELIGATDGAFAGDVVLQCSSPGEVCFNLSDDDGDGAVDCADLHCARDPRCVEDQFDLDVRTLGCSADSETLEPPELGPIDDQRTLYRRPGSSVEEFWGGAELMLGPVTTSGTVEITFGEAGMVCVGGIDEVTVISCAAVLAIAAGETRTFPTSDLPLRLEPLAATWSSLQARLVCD